MEIKKLYVDKTKPQKLLNVHNYREEKVYKAFSDPQENRELFISINEIKKVFPKKYKLLLDDPS